MENPIPCQICGDNDSSPHFGAISCRPCKMFFKRNAEIKQKEWKCYFNNHCNINTRNRHVCSACRLKKCFAQGMKIEMLRSARVKKPVKISFSFRNEEQIIEKPTNILQINPSIMTMEQWNLLSNLIQTFDLSQGIGFAQEFLQEQLILPLKFRFKYSVVRQFLMDLSKKTPFVFKDNPDILLLCSEDRSNLLEISRVSFTIFHMLIIVQQSRLINQTGFIQSIENLFGSKLTDLMQDFLDQFEFDLTFMKLIYLIFLFSTMNESIDTKLIIEIQNKYIELAWKYFLNQYNYHQTVLAFIKLVHCLFILKRIFDEFYDDQSLTSILQFIRK